MASWLGFGNIAQIVELLLQSFPVYIYGELLLQFMIKCSMQPGPIIDEQSIVYIIGGDQVSVLCQWEILLFQELAINRRDKLLYDTVIYGQFSSNKRVLKQIMLISSEIMIGGKFCHTQNFYFGNVNN